MRIIIITAFTAGLLLLAACGGSGAAEAPTPTLVPTLSPAPAQTSAAAQPTAAPATAIPAAPTAAPTTAPAVVTATASTAAMTATAPLTAAVTPVTPVTPVTLVTPVTPTQIITVAINAAFRPFVYQDEAGKLTGFDIDLLNAIGQAADIEVGFVNTSFPDVLDGVARGAYDAGISAITVTPERARKMDFTDPYFSTGQAPVSFYNAGQGLAVLVGSQTITGVASLTAATTVGVKQGTTGADFVANRTPAKLVAFPESRSALEALEQGKVDAVVLDTSVIVDYIKSKPGKIMLAGGPITEEQYAIAVSKSKPALLAQLNTALAQLRENGTLQKLFNKWFGAP